MKVGLVLEGGSRQTIFSAGILDAMLDENIVYPYICGVSAGGHAAMNYVTRQKGRLRHIIMPTKLQRGKKHANRILDGIQKESHALHYLAAYGAMPFDFQTFFNSPVECEFTLTTCETGRPAYLSEKNDEKNLLDIINASSSVPMLFPVAQIGIWHYVDGTVSDPIPFHRAFEKGCDKVVVISTHFPGESVTDFRKYSPILNPMFKRKYPNLFRVMMVRFRRYTRMFEELKQLEKAGKVFLMRPESDLCDLFETDLDRLNASYAMGQNYAARRMAELKEFLK